MYGLARSPGLLVTVFASAVLAQPAVEEDVDAAPRDPDEIAADELVRELREASQKLDPDAVLIISEEEVLVILEECPLYEMIDTELNEVELEFAETLSQDQMVSWRSQFRQARLRALHDCCKQQSAVCFQ